jgi:2'-5' RNA ligase
MPYAISLLLDDEGGDAIRGHWSALARAGISRSMLDLGYPPHITLRIYDDLDLNPAVNSLKRSFESAAIVHVVLDQLRTFSDTGVLYAGSSSASQLFDAHERAGILTQQCHPHYMDGHWIPHCTLATDLNPIQMRTGKELLTRDWQNLPARLTVVELVQFGPIKCVWRQSLVA